MKPKDNKPVPAKVLTEEDKKEIKRVADDKKKKTSNPQIIRK